METNTPLRKPWNDMQNAICDWAGNQCTANLFNVYTAITSFHRQLVQTTRKDYNTWKQAVWNKFKEIPLQIIEKNIKSIKSIPLTNSSQIEMDELLSKITEVKDRLSAIENVIANELLRLNARVCRICGLWRMVE